MTPLPPTSQEAPAFTVARIAAALGRFPQAVRKSLGGVKPSSAAIVNGQETAAYYIGDLPAALREALNAAARLQNYRNAAAMLTAPAAAPWQPPCKLSEIAQPEIDHANKLRDALLPFLVREHDETLSAAEFEAQGVQTYARSFGHVITTRHWRGLFRRTLDRDGGAENFGRIEIYLSDKPARKPAGPKIVCDALEEIADQFPAIADHISACGNPSAPDEMEQRGIWTLSFQEYDRLVNAGETPKRAARRLRDFLSRKAAFLAPSRNALRMAFDRKLERWIGSERDPAALQDRRKDNGDDFQFPEPDRDKLIHRSVFNYLGDVAPAWRDLLADGFSEIVRGRYAGKSHRKSRVPASIMDSIAPEVEILTVMQQGRRAFDSIKGHVSRNYDGVASLQCISADDFTLNTYFYVPDGKGWYRLIRGQTILFMDFRSLRILGWALEPHESYSSLTIRSLCTHIFSEFGLPDVLYFERGIWKNATLLKGKKDPFSFAQISQGLQEFGIKFIHAIRPRTKVIERVGGMFQDIAEAEPGYCGRDERHDRPETLDKHMAEVNTRKSHPAKYFYSYEQQNKRIGELAAKYNSTPQEGRILAGMSPDQAFEAFMDKENPREFPAGLRYLLAHDKRVSRVTLNGVTIQVGKKKFNYRGKEISGREWMGRDVLAWFDPENPEFLVVTDLNRQNPVIVARSQELDALECLTGGEQLGTELARIEDQASYMKTRFNVLKAKFPLPARKLLADAGSSEAVQLGQEIELGKGIRMGEAEAHRKNVQRASRLAADTGIVQPSRALGNTDPDAGRDLRKFLNRSEPAAAAPSANEGKTYFVKTDGTAKAPQRQHIDYLLNRLMELRKAGQKSFGQSFGGQITIQSVTRIARAELKCDLYAPENFERVCAHLQGKIDATILGKRNTAAGSPNYHPFRQEATP